MNNRKLLDHPDIADFCADHGMGDAEFLALAARLRELASNAPYPNPASPANLVAMADGLAHALRAALPLLEPAASPAQPEPRRIIIALEGGLVQAICAQGLDLEDLQAYVIDYDAEGSEDAIAGPVDPDFPDQPSFCVLGDWSGAVERPAQNVSAWLDAQAADR